MTARSFIIFSLFIISIFSFGCGGTANTDTTTNATTPAANTPAKDEMTNAAPTLTPVFKAFCEAMVKKDEAALRKIYSADTIKYFEEDMKASNIKSLIKYLEDDAVSGTLCEVRNEVITGDKAIAEIRADKYPNGIKIVFLKENGEWKVTTRSPNIDAVPPTDKAPGAPVNAANKPATDPSTKKEGK